MLYALGPMLFALYFRIPHSHFRIQSPLPYISAFPPGRRRRPLWAGGHIPYMIPTSAFRLRFVPHSKFHPQFIRGFELSQSDRFRYRTRYFIDSGIIGSKKVVAANYQRFKHLFFSKHEKKPNPVKGLDGMYSLKRLSEVV